MMMIGKIPMTPANPGEIQLLPGMLADRTALNRAYMMKLDLDNLLRNFRLEAGLWSSSTRPVGIHGGWEFPTCELRGHFPGHWLSAVAMLHAHAGDPELKARADRFVHELAICQEANGGEWAGPIPTKYLDRIAAGTPVWAPQYTLHKVLMGLWDMHAYTGSSEALDVLLRFANWFHRWSGQFEREHFNRMLEVETGGMLEIWADLYGLTGDAKHRDLMERYWRSSLFDKLLAGEDALTNQHANTTIPEILGAARAYEVTGEQRWKQVVDAYWKQAVTNRGSFCTGGQTLGEVWTPPHAQSARLGEKNQEHCTVYNMMRLADKLFQWSGDPSYADYWEQNLYNGILAQQHPQTGQITYFLPLHPGATKKWGSDTEDFWCCHGSLVQAHTAHGSRAFYRTDTGVALVQHQPCAYTFPLDDVQVRLMQQADPQTDSMQRPTSQVTVITASADRPMRMSLDIRIPSWAGADSHITCNGEPVTGEVTPGAFFHLNAYQTGDTVRVVMTKRLRAWPLPDAPDTYAFMDGPVVLAGLCADERILSGNVAKPETLLTADAEREWSSWKNGWRTTGLDHGFRLLPLYEITDAAYQVYFQIRLPACRP